MRPLLWVCFTLSGAASLALELLWMRSAALVVGATAPTAAAVLASYFAGLAIGGVLARQAPARAVRRYALLEFAAALGAVWSIAVFSVARSEGAERMLEVGGIGVRVALVALAVLPATVALGATLPVVGQALASVQTIGSRGGVLYALNTLGGAVGIAVMGFGAPALIGVRASYAVTIAASALAGGLALAIGDWSATVAPARGRVRQVSSRLRLVAGVAGFLAIGLEVLWTRLFAQVLHNSVYSFAAVSLVFLLAIAAGAAVAAGALRRVAAERVIDGALVVAGPAALAGLWTFTRWTDGLGYVGMERNLPEYLVRIVTLAAATAGPAALVSGALLPALWAAFAERESVAHPVGELTAANLGGAGGGALAAAFVAIPAAGLRGGFVLFAAGYVIAAGAFAGIGRAWKIALMLALIAGAAVDLGRLPIVHLRPSERLVDAAEGASGIVTVVDTGDDLQLRLDNNYLLGGSAAATNERRQGLLPLLLHPAPRRVAFIGMATGVSASAAPALGVEDTTVIEVVPEVVTMATKHFSRWNGRFLEQPGVRLVVDDGRRTLAGAASRFDVIVSDLFIPWHASAGSLYAREMYARAARRLAPGGLFCQWLPLYQLTREEFEIIARTFVAEFPHATLWRNDFYADRPVVGLVGTREPAHADPERIAARVAATPDWARDPLLAVPRSVAMLYLGDLSAARDLLGDGPANSDDLPLIEFVAPRMTRMGAGGDKDWFIADAFAAFAEALAERDAGGDEGMLPPSEDLKNARRAGRALFRYAVATRRGDPASAEAYEREVRRLVPEVVASSERESSPAAELSGVRRRLADLRAKEERLRGEVAAIEERLRERSGER